MARVLVTRAPHQASALADALAERGFDVLSIPAIDMVAPTDAYRALDAAIGKIAEIDWLIFTSANGVSYFAERWKTLKQTMPASIRTAVIGAATARAVQQQGWAVTLQPESAVAEAMAEALLPHAQDARMLLVRAEQGRDHLPEVLRRAGAQVTVAAAYKTIVPEESAQQLQREIDSVDAVCFTSSSSVLHLLALLNKAGVRMRPDAVLASIGPVTTATMLDAGLQPKIETSEASVVALADALQRFFSRL